MQTKLRKNDPTASRWFSTGFMAGGVGSVDTEKHTLRDAVLIRPGEALGHGVWIDSAFCADIAARGAASGTKGLKARFGHPGMCSEALGTFLGRWTDTKLDTQGRTIGDLHLSSTASESPKGDLRKYVEELAAKEPGHFGASIVFSMDMDTMIAECLANGAKEETDEYGTYLDLTGYKSPDPANAQNLPHARCAELHAADLVDEPAATDGMFAAASGMALAAQMTEWLDTHPQVFDALEKDDGLLKILERYPDKMRPFLARYAANQKFNKPEDIEPAQPIDEPKPAPAQPEGEPPAQEPAQSDHAQAPTDAMSAQLTASQSEVLRVTSELEASKAAHAALTEKIETAGKEITALTAERDEANRKLKALESGSPPLSSSAAPKDSKKGGSMWDDARKSGRK